MTMRREALIALAAGCAGLQLALTAAGSLPGALATGLRVTLATAILLLACSVAVAMLRGSVPILQAVPSTAARRETNITLLLALACVAIAAVVAPAPSRLAANGLAIAVWAPALWWVVSRRAGREMAARALLALSVFTVATAMVDLRNTRFIEDFRPDSPFRWPVGWPREGWVLRYEFRLDAPSPPRAAKLRLALARLYQGNTHILATLNGRDLGPAEYASGTMEMTVPVSREQMAGLTDFVFELRPSAIDRSLQLLAQPWAGGASLRLASTSYFDGAGWHEGTLNDSTGQTQSGIYVVRFEYTE
jgi:hypothetical protein